MFESRYGTKRTAARFTNRRWFRRIAARVLVAAGIVFPLAAFGAGTQASEKVENVTFAVADPSLSVSTSPYTSLPISLGFWKKAGLNVQIQPVSGGNAGVQAVGTGNAFMTETGMTSIYPGMVKDADLRLVGVHPNIYFVVVTDDSPIHSAKELKGKTIGVQALSAASYYYARAVVEAAGLNPDKDVQWVPVGVGFQAAAAQQNGTIQAYAGYDSVNSKFGQLLNKGLRIIPSGLNDLPGMLGWLVTQKTLDTHRQEVVGILRGIFESVVWAASHPEAAIGIRWKMFPASKPSNVSDETAMKNAKEILLNRIDIAYWPTNHRNDLIGDGDVASIQKTADFMYKNGFLKQPVEVSKFIDLSLIKEANDFDRTRIEADAKAYRIK